MFLVGSSLPDYNRESGGVNVGGDVLVLGNQYF